VAVCGIRRQKSDKYFGAAKDLPGVRELFESERKFSTDADLHTAHTQAVSINTHVWSV